MQHTTDVTTPSDLEIRMTRVFDAPRSLIFDCHTHPALVRRWLLGPPGWTMSVCDIDLRVGGQYHYVWRNDANGREFGFRGEFREISAPDRLVHTEWPDGDEAARQSPALCTLVLAEHNGRTSLTSTMRLATREIRDQVLQTGMTDGVAMSYDRIDTLVQERATV